MQSTTTCAAAAAAGSGGTKMAAACRGETARAGKQAGCHQTAKGNDSHDFLN